MLEEKICATCGESKPLEAFSKKKDRPGGREYSCKPCRQVRQTELRRANPERQREVRSEQYKRNPTAARAASARYRAAHPEARERDEERRRARREEVNARARELYAKRKAEVRARKAKHRAENREAYIARERERREANRTELNRRNREHCAKRRATPRGKLENTVRARVWLELTAGSKRRRKTFDLLGYTPDELKAHLENLFLPGMSWDNFGRGGWHIDHKIPLSAFNYDTPDHIDFKRAWALSNLQPLWERDNLIKHAKVGAPFQPNLAL